MPQRTRHDGRKAGELRPVRLTPNFLGKADGSCLIEMGCTRVICTASFTSGVPQWLAGKDKGWVTAEYGMLPASGGGRKGRPLGKPDGRAVEIQRLIGRVARTCIDTANLGENTVYLDCDVLEADGGTRTAAITGAYVALAIALGRAAAAGKCPGTAQRPKALVAQVAAVSVGVVAGRVLLDLDYREDSSADVDMNVAMLRGGQLVEVQASSERQPFDVETLGRMVEMARRGIRSMFTLQNEAVERGLKR